MFSSARLSPSVRRSLAMALAVAPVFEAVTVATTQVSAIRARSPWRDDPYDTILSFALVAVPVLVAMLVIRLAIRSRCQLVLDGSLPDAPRQMLRAALGLVGLYDAAAISAWAAVAVGAHRHRWNETTAVLLLAVGAMTVGAVVSSVTAFRAGALRRNGRAWQTDWLADLVVLSFRLSGRSRATCDRLVEAIRKHAVVVFGSVSVLGGLGVASVQALGEGWSKPGLFIWYAAVVSTSNFVACMIINAATGIVARPQPRWPRTEVAITAACVAIQVAVAFHTTLWTAITGHAPADLRAVTLLVVGAALLGALAGHLVARRVCLAGAIR